MIAYIPVKQDQQVVSVLQRSSGWLLRPLRAIKRFFAFHPACLDPNTRMHVYSAQENPDYVRQLTSVHTLICANNSHLLREKLALMMRPYDIGSL